MAENMVILGAGGFAREATLLVEEINAGESEEFRLLGFIDDDRTKRGLIQRGYKVLGGFGALESLPKSVKVICVIGDPAIKNKIVEKASNMERQFMNLVHPGVVLSGGVTLGNGVLINKGVIITTNIKIGDHVSINPGCGIGHDSVIGRFSTLMWRVNISGNVNIGAGCLVGSGATVLQGLTIGTNVTIGAGAVVTQNLPEGCTAVGVPARIIK